MGMVPGNEDQINFQHFIFGKKSDLLDYMSSVYSRRIVNIQVVVLMLKVWLSLNKVNDKE